MNNFLQFKIKNLSPKDPKHTKTQAGFTRTYFEPKLGKYTVNQHHDYKTGSKLLSSH